VAGTAEQRLAPTDGLQIASVLGGIVVAGIAAVAGGMPGVVLALAMVLAVRVHQHPEEAIIAGPLFLMVCEIILPSSNRLNMKEEAWEMYFWASGLLLITCAGFSRQRYKLLFKLPRSLQSFALVAFAASIYGISHGAELSYVIRQLYGAVLLCAYFALALRGMNEDSFLRAFRFYGVACALAFIVHYALVFGELGVHKEWTPLVTQTTVLAIPFAARRGWKWQLAAAVMLVPPLLDVMRREFPGFVLGIVLIWAFRARSRWRRGFSWALAGVIVVASLAPPVVDVILDTVTQTSVLDRFMPEGTRDASTVMERGMQVVSALSVLQTSPLFGSGMGSSFESYRAGGGTADIPYVDNGWAHLIVKMGIAGLLTFGWFAVNLVSWMPGRSVGLSACLLSMLLLVLFVEPIFFNFSTTPFLGAMAGLVYIGRNRKTADDNARRNALEVAR